MTVRRRQRRSLRVACEGLERRGIVVTMDTRRVVSAVPAPNSYWRRRFRIMTTMRSSVRFVIRRPVAE